MTSLIYMPWISGHGRRKKTSLPITVDLRDKQLNSLTALVVGASGYVGKHLCSVLEQAYSVFGTYFRSGEKTFHGESVCVDIRNSRHTEGLFKGTRSHIVFHLAYDLRDLDGSVVRGTENLLAAREKYCPDCCFIYVSTDAVFDGENGPYGEKDIPEPVWEYGQAKREAELMVLDAGGTLVRNSLVYGFDPMDPRTGELKQGFENRSF